VFIDLDKSKEGNYTCMAKNLWGEDQITYQVLVLMAPDAPSLELQHTTSRTIHLRWKTAGDGGAPIQGNQQDVLSRDNHQSNSL
jgi:hypothetical protein